MDRPFVIFGGAADDRRRTKVTMAKGECRDGGRSWGVSKSPTIGRAGIALAWAAMTQEFPIAARDHRAGIAQERFDGMAGRRCLPFVAVEVADVQEGLSDFLLCCAGAVSVEGLQHAAETRALLEG